MQIDKLIVTQIDDITAFNNLGQLEFMLDEVTDATISNTEDKQDITGRGGRKIASLKRNKAVKVSGTNGFLTTSAFASMAGSDISTGKKKIRETDIITFGASTLTAYKAVGTVGSEIKYVYKVNANGSLGDKLVQTTSATPATGEFKYDVNTKALTFASSAFVTGDKLCAFYDREVDDAVWMTNESVKYSKTLKLVINATAIDNCDAEYHVQFIIPRADFEGNFDISIGNEASTLGFSAEALAGGCGMSNEFYEMIVF